MHSPPSSSQTLTIGDRVRAIGSLVTFQPELSGVVVAINVNALNSSLRVCRVRRDDGRETNYFRNQLEKRTDE